ncbi:MAG TPA: hypothetical protein VKB19_16545 [Pedobacter sp.]|nr:hypothetical protein [Pedobacter sp.]
MKKNGSFETLGSIDSVLIAGNSKTLPEIKADENAAGVSGKKTSDLSAGVALSILGNIISAMGGNLGIDAQYTNAKTITFEFQDVKSDSVDIIKLDMYLNDADIDPLSKQVRALLESDDIFIITSVIKSNKISVEGTKKDNSGLKVDVPVVKEIVGGKINIESNGDEASKVSYSGDSTLVFGFKAIRLVYEKGKYSAFEQADEGTPLSIDSPEWKERGTINWLSAQENLVQFQ